MLPTSQRFLVRLFKRLYVLSPDAYNAYTLKSSLNIGCYYLTVFGYLNPQDTGQRVSLLGWVNEIACARPNYKRWDFGGHFFLSSLQTAADIMALCSGSVLVAKKAPHVLEAWQAISSNSFYVHFLSFFSYRAQTPPRQFL